MAGAAAIERPLPMDTLGAVLVVPSVVVYRPIPLCGEWWRASSPSSGRRSRSRAGFEAPYCDTTPFARSDLPTLRKRPEQPRARRVTHDEAERLLAACSPHLRDVVIAAAPQLFSDSVSVRLPCGVWQLGADGVSRYSCVRRLIGIQRRLRAPI
jgi:hypothetical protein